jgi:hypothetical protein
MPGRWHSLGASQSDMAQIYTLASKLEPSCEEHRKLYESSCRRQRTERYADRYFAGTDRPRSLRPDTLLVFSSTHHIRLLMLLRHGFRI